MSVRIGNKVIAGGNSITVDSALNVNSINPVQNGVIASAINNKQDTITAGSGITITNNTVAVGNLNCGTLS